MAEVHEGAQAVGCAGLSKVEVELFVRVRGLVVVPHAAEAPEIPAELGVPAVDEDFRVRLNRFYLAYHRLGDDDSADANGLDWEASLLGGPAIAEELRTEIPMVAPSAV